MVGVEFLSYLKPYKWCVFLRIISTTLKAVIDILIAKFVMQIISAITSGNKEGLINAAYFIVFLISIGLMIYFADVYLSGYFSTRVIRDLRQTLMVHLEKLPISFCEAHNTGEIIAKLSNDINGLEAFLSGGFINIIFHIIRFSGSFIYALLISPELLLFSLVIIPIALYFSNKTSKPIEEYNKALHEELGKLNSEVLDCIGGIHTVKAYKLEKELYKKYSKRLDCNLEYSLKIEKRKALLTSISIVVQLLPFALCCLFGGYLVISRRLSFGEFIAFTLMLSNIVQSAGAMPGHIGVYREKMGIIRSLFQFMSITEERTNGELCMEINTVTAIEFKDVSISYNAGIKVLNELNFRIETGKITAIVGPSGGGKTTIFKIICSFYKASGAVLLYGCDINTLKPASIRERISLVSQDTYLFPGTIAENIELGKVGSSRDKIIEAAKAANAHDFIMELSMGYDTIVGEAGILLSGGQKQRIAISRAILKNAPILLFDEPTSALDSESENIVYDAIKKLGKDHTVVIIAHRLATIREADNILVIDKGSIREHGTHEELIKRNGLYSVLNKEYIF